MKQRKKKKKNWATKKKKIPNKKNIYIYIIN